MTQVTTKHPPDCRGYLWEYSLSQTNWNELPHEKQTGRVIGVYELPNNSVVLDIEWANGHISKNVFPDEVKLWKK